MADWARIANTTIREYIRDEEVNVLRNRKLTERLRKRGRITFNHGGDDMDWKVRFKRAPMFGYADTDTLTFSRVNRWKTATLPWRGYASTDSMTKAERLKNKSTEAIIKVYDQIAKDLMEDIEDQFGDEFYIDGNAAANSRRMHGLETMMAGATSGALAAANAATYAGIDTTRGAFGGTWSGTWPGGTGPAHFDFWTPLIVSYTNSGWTASTDTWPNTCVEALRFGSIHSRKNKSTRGKLDLVFLENELYRQFLAQQEAKENIYIVRGKSSDGDLEVGFGESTYFDGVEITFEYGLPAGVGYGFNVDQMELRSMQSQLFVPEGPDWDIASQSWRFSIDFFGNCRFNPRYFVKWVPLN